MTIEMTVPAHSGKKVYEEATTLYEQKKAANVFNMGGMILESETLNEAKKLVHVAGDPTGHHAKVYHLSGNDNEGDPYHVRLFHGKKEHTPAEYFTNDLEDAKGTAEDMAKRANESVELDEATAAARTIAGRKPTDADSDTPKKFSAPTGLTGPLASMFGVTTAPAPTQAKRAANDRTDPATQEHGKVATPDDLAVKIHSSLPGMTRKAVGLGHIVAALKAGIKAEAIHRLAHSAVGRKNLRSYNESVDSGYSEQIAEMMAAWTVEFIREGASHKFVVRDGDDIISEGVNLTLDAAMKSAARSIEELGASLEEQTITLREEKEYESARPSRIINAVRSLITK